MSREAFIQSEDKEFEVTFREVRNWEEYSDLDFEADTAPLTDDEAGIHEEEPVLTEEWSVVVPTEEVSNTESEETSDEEETEDVADTESDVVAVEDTPISEEADETDPSDEEDTQAEDETATDEETDVEAEEDLADTEAGDVDAESKDEDSATGDYASDTSQEAVVTLPVVEDNFDMGPAWEDDEASDNAEVEEADEEELPVGESAEDTESFGSSLESSVNAESEVETGEEKTVYFDPMNASMSDLYAEAEQIDLTSTESVDLDPFALALDEPEEDTFEAISGDDESLNKADTVEELAPEYAEDTLPDTVAIEAVDAGDYFSFEGIELGAEEPAAPVVEEVKESEDDDSDDEELSLELDYSEED